MSKLGALTSGADTESPRRVDTPRLGVSTLAGARWLLMVALLIVGMALAGCEQVPDPSLPTVTPVALRAPSTPTPNPALSIVLAPEVMPTLTPTATPTVAPETGVVVQVLDGDTIRVNVNGALQTVGYLLVDAPPLLDPYGPLAWQMNRSLALSQTVQLVRESSDFDRAGRRLRNVFLTDGTLVNAEMLRQGWATVVDSPVDGAHEEEFRALEEGARSAGVGMWSRLNNAVAAREVELRSGPDMTFPVMATLPFNTVLQIDGMTPDAAWYRLEGGFWLAADEVVNPPQVAQVPYAAVPTPIPTATMTETPTPTATPTVLPTPTFAIGTVQIVYVDKRNEYFILRNGTSRLLHLDGWKVLSENGGEICFLAGSIQPLTEVIVWSQRGPDLRCNMEFPMWDDVQDDSAVLYSPSGFVIHRYQDPSNLPGAEEGDGSN